MECSWALSHQGMGKLGYPSTSPHPSLPHWLRVAPGDINSLTSLVCSWLLADKTPVVLVKGRQESREM